MIGYIIFAMNRPIQWHISAIETAKLLGPGLNSSLPINFGIQSSKQLAQ